MGAQKRPPRLVAAWEGLQWQVQFGVSYVVSVVLLFIIHITVLNQPLLRGFAYALFWAVFTSAALVAASRNEAAKRRGDLPPDAF
jgi:hypothetical protein